MEIHRLATTMSNAYLVETGTGGILIDTGSPNDDPTILKTIQDLGINLLLIFITHAHIDHYGSAGRIRDQTGAPIAIHRMDGPMLAEGITRLGETRGMGSIVKVLLPIFEMVMKPQPISPDWLLEDGDILDDLGINATSIHTPGHTPGSSSLLFEDGAVFVGDLLSSTHRPHLQRYFAHDWSQIPKSVRKLQNLHPQWIYPGHGKQPVNVNLLDTLINNHKPKS